MTSLTASLIDLYCGDLYFHSFLTFALMGAGSHHHAPFKKLGFRWMGGWLGPKIGLDVVEDKLSLSRFEARTVYPVAYSLHYRTQTTK
jgi:hypothetical protein